jgi:malonyl-CoA O-methyltransferase
MTTKNHFTQYAKEYDDNNIIQRIVSKALLRDITSKPKNILELGCGSGQIFRQINWKIKNYTAIDFSPSMCELHPKNDIIEVACYDFDSNNFINYLKNKNFDVIISSSSLQWSKNLPKLLQTLSYTSNELYAVLFTSNTFKRIYEITQENKKILSLDEIKNAFSKYSVTFEVFNYNLEFQNKKELFTYIKNSGVQGDGKLDFKTAKKLYQQYDLNYLEFEVVFVKCQLN